MPASAARRLAAGSSTPRSRRAAASAARDRRELDQLALQQLERRSVITAQRRRANAWALREHRLRRPAGLSATRLQRRRAPRARRAAAVTEQLLEGLAAAEQHLALVGEVAEEGALRQPGALGDLGDGRRLISLLVEQFDRGAIRRPWASGFQRDI